MSPVRFEKAVGRVIDLPPRWLTGAYGRQVDDLSPARFEKTVGQVIDLPPRWLTGAYGRQVDDLPYGLSRGFCAAGAQELPIGFASREGRVGNRLENDGARIGTLVATGPLDRRGDRRVDREDGR